MPDQTNDTSSATSNKIARRLIPFLMLCYFVAYLDRVNAGFAALTMNKDLGLTAEMFGFGAGIFFFGYFLFEVPSNLIMEKTGARIWIARIMITWGILSAAFAFIPSISAALQGVSGGFFDQPRTFYMMRFIFGAAEAGFFPGIILYLTYWFTAAERARWVGAFMASIPLSSVLGGPFSGWILDAFNGAAGLKGWQWLFLIEGIPSVIVGFWVLGYLTDRPADAQWLSADERTAVQGRLDAERANRETIKHFSLGEALTNPRVLGLALVYFGLVSGNYGLGFWLPTMVKASAQGLKLDVTTGIGINTLTGFLVAVPYACAVVAMILWTRHSDRKQERVWHVAVPALIGGVALMLAAFLSNPWLAALALTICAMGTYSALPTFWALPTAFLTGTAAAGGIALINAIGNVGGFAGPYAVGWIKDTSVAHGWAADPAGANSIGLAVLACCYLMAGVVTILLGHDSRIEMAGQPEAAE